MSNSQLGKNSKHRLNFCHRFELKLFNLRQFLVIGLKITSSFFPENISSISGCFTGSLDLLIINFVQKHMLHRLRHYSQLRDDKMVDPFLV